jgi:hypothetical protein
MRHQRVAVRQSFHHGVVRGRAPVLVWPRGRVLIGQPLHASTSEAIINLKAAKQMGLTIPPAVLGRADEVIE